VHAVCADRRAALHRSRALRVTGTRTTTVEVVTNRVRGTIRITSAVRCKIPGWKHIRTLAIQGPRGDLMIVDKVRWDLYRHWRYRGRRRRRGNKTLWLPPVAFFTRIPYIHGTTISNLTGLRDLCKRLRKRVELGAPA
jgi:hypothetical protein